MAGEEYQSNDDRTEEATPERREEFRSRGQVAVSREITAVAILLVCTVFFSFYIPHLLKSLQSMFINHFSQITSLKLDINNFMPYFNKIIQEMMLLVLPILIISGTVVILVTFLQTRFNFSWKKVSPDFTRLNPIQGIMRMFSFNTLLELSKGILKIVAILCVSYFILKKAFLVVPTLINFHIIHSWNFWATITSNLFWSVGFLLAGIALIDFLYNYFSIERKMRMTKEELKEELKRREGDPFVKSRIRKLQRDFASKRMIDSTKKATVLITNPTHYSVAIKYEFGMRAPIVIAKGVDFLALRMREVAKQEDIPIVENKPLARSLYDTVEINEEIPETLYKAVAEVIRFVFKLKGINIPKKVVTA